MAQTYTPEQLQFIREYCKTYTDPQLAQLFRLRFGEIVTADMIKGTRHRYKMLTGRCGRFKPGSKPHPLAGAKSANSTSFKKGQRPINHRPVGSERISRDGITEIKVAEPKTWRSKHAVIWERHHGRPIPKGHLVRFMDGDRTNMHPDNLVLVTRGENATLNRHYRNSPPELMPINHALIKLETAIKKRQRETA